MSKLQNRLNFTRKFRVVYQLGGRGPVLHNKFATAIRALQSAQASARGGGDLQGIGIEVCEYKADGSYYGEGALTEAEQDQLDQI